MEKLAGAVPCIFADVVRKNKCCGCGVCAGVCPHETLSMQFNQYGEYNPVMVGNCVQCGLCEQACPFLHEHPNEDEIGQELYAKTSGMKFRKETGYYLDSYVGYAPNQEMHRNGVSGGVATWILCQLLERQLVDHVIAVVPTPNPERYFEFGRFDSCADVKACAGTVYYPVELSDAIQHILKNQGTYAVICLPCVSKALRKASASMPRLKERIGYIIGLACLEQRTSFYAEHLIGAIQDPPEGSPEKIRFRAKRPDLPAHTPEFLAVYQGQVEKRVLMMQDWGLPSFQMGACFRCDDAFAETADVVLMDAWLPDYRSSPAGHSIVLTRDRELSEILSTAPSLKPIVIDDVIRSQLGALYNKKCAHYPRGGRPLLSGNKPHITLQKLKKYFGFMRIRCGTAGARFFYLVAEQACRLVLNTMRQVAHVVKS